MTFRIFHPNSTSSGLSHPHLLPIWNLSSSFPLSFKRIRPFLLTYRTSYLLKKYKFCTSCIQSIIIQNEFLRSNSVLRYSQIQTLLKINCCIAAICTFRVTQHYQIFSLSFRTANSMQCALPIYRQFPGSAQLTP